jgi:anti-sigma B factor antagonist
MSNLRTQITRRGPQADIVVISASGTLDTMAAYAFHDQMQSLVRSGLYRYILDFQDLEYISSAGIGVFPGLLAELQQHQGGLIFVQVPAKIYKLFDMIGMLTLFPVMASVEHAVKEFERR